MYAFFKKIDIKQIESDLKSSIKLQRDSDQIEILTAEEVSSIPEESGKWTRFKNWLTKKEKEQGMNNNIMD